MSRASARIGRPSRLTGKIRPRPNRHALRQLQTLETTRWQYFHGVSDPESRVSPEAIALDQALLDRPQSAENRIGPDRRLPKQRRLVPQVSGIFRRFQPPTLAVWGKNDPFFLPAGAEAYRRDNPSAKVVFYDTGHFALETHADEIGAEIRTFQAAALK